MKLSELESVVKMLRAHCGNKVDPQVDFWETSECRKAIQENIAAGRIFLSLALSMGEIGDNAHVHLTPQGNYSLPLMSND